MKNVWLKEGKEDKKKTFTINVLYFKKSENNNKT